MLDSNNLEQNLTYPPEILSYLRSKLDEGSLKCFKLVVESTGPYGVLRTKLPDFKENRRLYDLGFTILEAQGFIRAQGIGNMRPYFLTIRGIQLKELLESEVN